MCDLCYDYQRKGGAKQGVEGDAMTEEKDLRRDAGGPSVSSGGHHCQPTRNATANAQNTRVFGSEVYCRQIFDAVSEAIVIHDAETGAFLDVNKKACEMFGFELDELRGMKVEQISSGRPPYTQADAERWIRRARLEPQLFEWEIKHKSGKLISAEVHLKAATIVGHDCVIAIVRDVTERKKTREELIRSRQMLQLVLDTIPVRVFWKDRNSIYLGCNRRFAADAGVRSPEEIIGMNDFDIPWHQQAESYRADDGLVMESGQPKVNYEEPQTTPDGREIWLRTSKVPLRDIDDNTIGVLGTYEDITEDKRAEEALRQSEEKYRQLAESTSDWVWEVNSEGKYTYSSPKVRDLLGYEPGEVLGKRPFDFMEPAEAGRVKAIFEDAIARGAELEAIENTNLRKDGTHVVLETNGVPFYDDQGSLLGYRGIDRDITERKRAEQELRSLNASLEQRVAERTAVAEQRAEQLRKLAGEMTQAEQRERRRVATILHEHLQQLLVAAQMRIDAIQEKSRDAKSTQILKQIHDLLGESVDTARSLTVELSPPVLHELGLVEALDWLAEQMLDKHGLNVVVELERRSVVLSEDLRVFLFHAVRELLFNVVKHSGQSEAYLKLDWPDDSSIRISVSDEGIGFDTTKSQLDKFGLFSIRERIDLLGGRLKVASQPGKGTHVELSTRIKPGKETLRPSRATAEGAVSTEQDMAKLRRRLAVTGRQIHVLLADDHKIMREGLAQLLQMEPDIEVVAEAADGQEAIDMSRKFRPDVVIMDVTMPKFNGIEATRRIISELPEVQVIGLSMHEDAGVAAGMRQAGAVSYLTKGGPAEDLVRAIRAAKRPQ